MKNIYISYQKIKKNIVGVFQFIFTFKTTKLSITLIKHRIGTISHWVGIKGIISKVSRSY